MTFSWRLWACLHLPWHRITRMFWLSDVAEVARCSCGREWAVNHAVQAIIPYNAEVKAFYAERRDWLN